jgi:hypothetical protein
MKTGLHSLLANAVASLALPGLVLLASLCASGQTIQQDALNLNIGFNGPDAQFPYEAQFYDATNAYYRSIGLPGMPGTRHCHAYLSWDIAEQAVGSGPISQEGSRSWFEDWLKHAEGQCDEALVTFKYVSGVTGGTAFPSVSDYETAFTTFLSTSWAYTGWTGTFVYTPWNEPDNGSPSGDGLKTVLDAHTAADYYLAIRANCDPSNCTVAAGDFGSNGQLGNGYYQNCADDVQPLCSNATYMDTYKHYLVADAPSFGLAATFRPEIFAYHGWDDINDYINQTYKCNNVSDQVCTIYVLLNSLSQDTWANVRIWDDEVGAGQNPQTNPDPITQACAASFLLRLTAIAAGSRIDRIYYTRPDEAGGGHWSLFDSSGAPKPAFYVLADRNTLYTPPEGYTCPDTRNSVQLVVTAALTSLSDGSYQATVTVANNGGGAADDVQLTGAALGSAAGAPVPTALGTIGAGNSAVATIDFPSSAGSPGSTVVERYTGTYTGGTFSGSMRGVLPQ